MKIIQFFKDSAKRDVAFTIVAGVSLGLSLSGILRGALPFDIAWVAILVCGIPLLIFTFLGVFRDGDITADLLVSIAFVSAIIIGEYFAAGEVVWIMAIGKLLEDAVANRAQKGIEKLIKLTPKTSRVKRDGISNIIPTTEVIVGDTLIVLAGETIPVDGIITLGATTIDQANMTGESVPIDKTKGDEVISGTVNQFGTFEMRASRNGQNSTLQRMIQLARDAEANKAPIVKLADKWAKWLVVVALLTAGLTWIFTGEVLRAVTVLVVFCPCAFVLATPTAVIATIGNLAKYGILVRSGDGLQRFSKIDEIVFDKTGTLTFGKPIVIGVVSIDESYTNEDILRISALAEQRSEHPLGKAIVNAYTDKGGILTDVQAFVVKAGMGIYAKIDSIDVIIGKADFIKSESISIENKTMLILDEYSRKGATVVLVSLNKTIMGLIALSDTVRPTVKQTIMELNSIGIEPTLLTGDNQTSAQFIADQVGIRRIKSNVLPEEKMQEIRNIQQNNRHVLMIGDGVNDTLALKTAFAGIAMGGIGSDIAVEASDAVLVTDDINHVPYLLKLSQKAMKRITFNIIIGMIWNAAAIILSIAGQLNPIGAALVHNIGSAFVVISSALLLGENIKKLQITPKKTDKRCRC